MSLCRYLSGAGKEKKLNNIGLKTDQELAEVYQIQIALPLRYERLQSVLKRDGKRIIENETYYFNHDKVRMK